MPIQIAVNRVIWQGCF